MIYSNLPIYSGQYQVLQYVYPNHNKKVELIRSESLQPRENPLHNRKRGESVNVKDRNENKFENKISTKEVNIKKFLTITPNTLNHLNKAKFQLQNTFEKKNLLQNFHNNKANLNDLTHQQKLNEFLINDNDAASLIVSPFLFLGGHRSVKDVNILSQQGVTHVLNMASELKLDANEMRKKNIKFLHITARDSRLYNLRSDFEKAFAFIDDALRTRGKIIVNCARGISRSATIVIAYLMYRFNLSLHDSLSLTTRLRPQVRPNSNFRRQLEIYERELMYTRYKIYIRPSNLQY